MLARPKVEPRERHEACPTLPLWQTTTLCGSETPSLHLKPVDPVSMQHNKDAIVSLPAVTYHSKTSLRTATLTPKSIHSDFAPAISTFHPFRSNDWVIVMVSAYCKLRQVSHEPLEVLIGHCPL